jgi:hypothetical protein
MCRLLQCPGYLEAFTPEDRVYVVKYNNIYSYISEFSILCAHTAKALDQVKKVIDARNSYQKLDN